MKAATGRFLRLPAFSVVLAVACNGDQSVSPPNAGPSMRGSAATMGAALVPFSNGDVIHACVLNSGLVKVVGEGETCPAGQTALQWNVAGESGVSGYEVVRADFEVAAGGFLREFLACPAGKVVLGGGAQVAAEGTADFHTVLQESTPATLGGGAQSGWLVAIRNDDTAAHTIAVSATCASMS